MQVYIAGGAVRDLLLGRRSRDKDYLVLGASKNDFLLAFPQARLVGKAFPVFIDQGREFAFPRAQTLEQDLLARDLTINAMALAPDGELICHPEALHDIQTKILRPASANAMKNDPLRIIRAARLWSMLPDFSPHPTLIKAMQNAAKDNLLQNISADRIGLEVMKALRQIKPGNFLRLLHKGKCLSPWFQGLEKDIEDTALLMDSFPGAPKTVWAALCHSVMPSREEGPSTAWRLGINLKMPAKFVQTGDKAARLHKLAAAYSQLKAPEKVDLLMKTYSSSTFTPVFRIAEHLENKEIISTAQQDLTTILKVSLSDKEKNLGRQSGQILRTLRSKALQNDEL